MKRLTEFSTYADLTGRRRPRRYVWAAAGLLGLVLLVLLWGLIQRQRARAVVLGNNWPLATVGLEAGSRILEGQTPAGGEDESGSLAACPPDPADWTFQPVAEEGLYSLPAPACVGAELERAVAWLLLTRLGYSKPEAADLLGFDALPWQPAARLPGYLGAGSRPEIQLTREWPAHPSYRYWIIAEDYAPGLAALLQGCYPPQQANRPARSPTNEFQVYCAVWIEYSARWGLHHLKRLTAVVEVGEPKPRTALVLFGYRGQGAWVYLGEGQAPAVSRESPSHPQPSGFPYLWDAEWLRQKFDLGMRPLPADWQAAGDPAALAAIGAELTRYINHE